jgi:hypothetical protein
MSIKFICTCGKHLRARDEMAGRRSLCPRCGRPVGIPSNESTQQGAAAAPLSPLDRMRTRRVVPHFEPTIDTAPPVNPAEVEIDLTEEPRPLPRAVSLPPPSSGLSDLLETAPSFPIAPPDPTQVRLRKTRETKHRKLKKRQPWELETRWHHSLRFPFRAWPLVVGLAILLTLLTAGAVLLIRGGDQLSDAPWWFLLISVPVVLIPVAGAGYACGFLDCVLISAMAGEAQEIRWPGWKLELAFRSSGTWALCFLAGPVVLFVVAFFFWLYCGDPTWLDWFILGELLVAAVGYGLLNLLSVSRNESLRDLRPAAVVQVIQSLGWPLAPALIASALTILALLAAVLYSLVLLHSEPVLGLAGLTGSWFAVLFVTSFLLRALGVWWFRAQKTR